jgi:hypothetical protein
MIKPAFNIGSPEISLVDWQRCRLVIELNQQFLHYVVLEENEKVLLLRYYQFAAKKAGDVAGFTEEVLTSDEVLQQNMKEVIVIYNWPENCFVPGALYDKSMDREYLELVHGDFYNCFIASEKIRSADTYNVFRLPAPVHESLYRKFPGATFVHQYSAWLDCRQNQPPEQDQSGKVSVLFYRNTISISVVMGEEVKLVQSMEYQTAEDVAYHLLNICHQLGLHPEKTIFDISGMIDLNSAMYKELQKYFLLIETDRLPAGLQVPEEMNSFPEHFFLPLLKLAVCVS